MNSIFLSISGFNIAISFKDSEDAQSKIANSRLRKNILDLYRGYLTKKGSHTDFLINIENNTQIPPLLKKGDTVYGFFFKKESNEKYSCATGLTIFQFSSILRSAILLLLQKHPGFMIHSSSAKVGTKAYVFVGKSGAGKTTTMRLLSKKFRPLGDDSSIIKKEGARFYSYQTPLFENIWKIERGGKRYDLGKIIFLKKSKEFKLEKIKNKSAILEKLTRQIVCEEEKLNIYLPHLFDFVKNFDGFYTLHFDKKPKQLIELLGKS